MIDSHLNNVIIRRRIGVLNGKKLNMKPIGFGEGNYLHKFSICTSLHGVIYLGEPKRPLFERIFWVCIMSLVFLTCGYQTRQLYNNWMESNIITILSEDSRYLTASSYVPFPGITMCSDLQLQNLQNKNMSENQTLNKEYEDGINLLCRIYEPKLGVIQDHIDPKTWDLLLNEHRIFCEQRVITVSWMREKIQIPCQYFQPIYTNYGICYSLNMVPFNQLLNDDYNQVLSKLNHTKAGVMIMNPNESVWNPEVGFGKNAKKFQLPWKLIGGTVEDSVIITLNLNRKNSGEHCPKTDTGMTIFLHSPIDLPVSMHPTAYTTVNNVVYVTTTFTLITTSQRLKSWNPEIRHCYYQSERTLKFFRVYSINNCDIECRANNTLKMCGCVAYYHPRDSKTPICGSASFNCMRKHSNNGYSIFKENFPNINTTNECNCLNACTDISYKHNVVNTHVNFSKTITSSINRNHDMAVIVMFYKRNVWTVHKTALISVNELLGNIGGSLGLFLGGSIISVFEIIYFFVVRLYVDRWNKKKATKNNTFEMKY